jgi:hypothetical protein
MKDMDGHSTKNGIPGSRRKIENLPGKSGDWRDMKLSKLRKIILGADPDIIEGEMEETEQPGGCTCVVS